MTKPSHEQRQRLLLKCILQMPQEDPRGVFREIMNDIYDGIKDIDAEYDSPWMEEALRLGIPMKQIEYSIGYNIDWDAV